MNAIQDELNVLAERVQRDRQAFDEITRSGKDMESRVVRQFEARTRRSGKESLS